ILQAICRRLLAASPARPPGGRVTPRAGTARQLVIPSDADDQTPRLAPLQPGAFVYYLPISTTRFATPQPHLGRKKIAVHDHVIFAPIGHLVFSLRNQMPLSTTNDPTRRQSPGRHTTPRCVSAPNWRGLAGLRRNPDAR